MSAVSIRFRDQDQISGTAPDLDFDRPSFFLHRETGETVLVALAAVQLVELSSGGEPPAGAALSRAAIRFSDGEVLDGYVVGEVERREEAVVVTFYPLERGLPSGRLAVPLGSLKGVFFSRAAEG